MAENAASSLVQLTLAELITRLREVKERALSDAFAVDQEFGDSHTAASSEAAYADTAAVIDEVIRRLHEWSASIPIRIENEHAIWSVINSQR